MKTFPIFKCAMLVILGFASWFVTSSVIFHGRLARTAEASTGPAGPATAPGQDEQVEGVSLHGKGKVEKVARGGEAEETFTGKLHPGGVACGKLTKMNASVDGRTVTFSAFPLMRDDREGITYMWHLIVKDLNSTDIILSRQYRDQIFSLKPGETHKPTFKETVELNPGNYRFYIRIYEIPVNYDLDKLDEGNIFMAGFVDNVRL